MTRLVEAFVCLFGTVCRFEMRLSLSSNHLSRPLPTGRTAHIYMLIPVLTAYAVAPAAPVAEAVRLMLAHQIKRLVVVDEKGKPLGFVDRQQLLRSLIEGGELSS